MTIEPVAAGARTGTSKLMLNTNNLTVATASGRFVQAANGVPGWSQEKWTRTIVVPLTTLDALIARHGMPAFVKIDVEGFEFEVLKGSGRLLSDIRPTLIIEIHPPQLLLSGGSEELLFETLENHHYRRSIIDRNPNSLFTIIATPW